MKNKLRLTLRKLLEAKGFVLVVDFANAVLVALTGPIYIFFSRIGPRRLAITRETLRRLGFFPIRRHFYLPSFSKVDDSFGEMERVLPGIDFKEENQVLLLKQMAFKEEIEELELDKPNPRNFGFDLANPGFRSGDAEFLYSFIRLTKPSLVVEIGIGFSTRIIQLALQKNRDHGRGTEYRHIGIDPYETALPSYQNFELIRKPVERIDDHVFKQLGSGDLLFIDSSHMINSCGDVTHEFLKIIPQLQTGVNIHVHDIFSPYDYPAEWKNLDVNFWNEQYLLEALLSDSPKYQVIASLHLLSRKHYSELSRVCPHLDKSRRPGSFYFRIT